MALMKVIQNAWLGQLINKTAGLMLYALQTASANLPECGLRGEYGDDIVIDRDEVHRTCINGPHGSKMTLTTSLRTTKPKRKMKMK